MWRSRLSGGSRFPDMGVFDTYALLLLIALPTLGALVILITPGRNLRAVRLLATLTAALTAAV